MSPYINTGNGINPNFARLSKCHCEERSEEAIPSLEIASLSLAMTEMVMVFKNPCEIRDQYHQCLCSQSRQENLLFPKG